MKFVRMWALLRIFLVGLLGCYLTVEASEEEGVAITYGSVLKLMHGTTKIRLHSSDVRYKGGGPYHVVTGYKGVVDSDSYWVVKPVEGSSAMQGDLIPDGSIIRLQHLQTNNWLHSRSYPSPLSNNLEVSCRDGRDEKTGDLWRLEFVDESEVWMKDGKVRLKHIDTGSFLHCHEKTYLRVIPGQNEVCAAMEESIDNVWLACEGVYLNTGSTMQQGNLE